MCGGTWPAHTPAYPRGGLSPRVRGNRSSDSPKASGRGSIPACAGEPVRLVLQHRGRRVYPRVCGGTKPKPAVPCTSTGLSPRVRGNRRLRSCTYAGSRSIPACAGEPLLSPQQCRYCAVYPRVCGGTWDLWAFSDCSIGLSPRVRGNPVERECPSRQLRSIPACAGEPSSKPLIPSSLRVYPRVCGGTSITKGTKPGKQGLSPRVRGNRLHAPLLAGASRSIPACAGEPQRRSWICGCIRVYPRVCGGTLTRRLYSAFSTGLSPRVRGNLTLGE